MLVPVLTSPKHKVLQRLSAKELAEIEGNMRMEEAAAAERRRQQEAERKAKAEAEAKAAEEAGVPGTEAEGEDAKAKPAGETKAGGKGKAGAETEAPKVDKAQQQQRDWFALLQEYPPRVERRKKDEISRRFAVIGAKPSEKEQRFVDKFDEWKKACAQLGAIRSRATSRRASRNGQEAPQVA